MMDHKMGNQSIEIETRNRMIMKYNIAGIIMNLLLSVSKIIIGVVFASHTIQLDGFNSLADLLSASLSIACTILGAKKASKNHPFGYGRVEYLFSMIITLIIMYIGTGAIIKSVQLIIHPEGVPQYSRLVIIVMIFSLVGKAVYGIAVRKKGREIHSLVMQMTGTESLGDALVSAAILFAMIVYNFTGVEVEHYLCIAISLLILYTGVKMIIESLTKILGTRVDPELKKKLIQLFIEEDEIQNVSSIILHNYGENIYVGSADIDVDEKMSAGEISALSRKLMEKAKACGITITSIGISGSNYEDPEAIRIRDRILTASLKYPSIEKVHSIHTDLVKKEQSFCIVQRFGGKEHEKERNDLLSEIEKEYPDMAVQIYTSLNA